MAKKFIKHAFPHTITNVAYNSMNVPCVKSAEIEIHYSGEIRTQNTKTSKARYNWDIEAILFNGFDVLPLFEATERQPIDIAIEKHIKEHDYFGIDPEPKPTRFYNPSTVFTHLQ